MRRTYLIQNPYDLDAARYIDAMAMYFGLRPLCFYTDPKARFYGEREYPFLRGDAVEARFDVDPSDLDGFVREVSERWQIAAVVPYREDTVEVAAELYRLLDPEWNPAEVLARFRDKYALKTFIRARDPSVRVPFCMRVRSAEELRGARLPARFVLKPNDGFGNQHVGFFDRAEGPEIDALLRQRPRSTWILEEYIGGPELHVDGQVRSNGEIDFLGVFRYERVEINDYPTVYRSEVQVHTDEPLFHACTRYAASLLAATGLRRFPFHMEMKVDERGPCMVDLGARLPSEGGGPTLSRLHPERPDVYAVATHDLLGPNPFAVGRVDWATYDAQTTVLVYGISREEGLIGSITGVDAVERLPGFVGWAVRPQVGDRVQMTRDLRSAPYIAELSIPRAESWSDLVEQVHATVRWETVRSLGQAAVRAHLAEVSRRAPPKLSWMSARLVRRVTGR